MKASRNPRGRKCSAARITAWSKSGCSNSRTGSALLRLPFRRVRQGGKDSEIKPRERVEADPQPVQHARRLPEFLPESPEDRPDARRLGRGRLEHALEPPRFAE